MRHFIVAVVVGLVAVIGLIWVSGDDSTTYEEDIEQERVASFGSTYEAANYAITPQRFECGIYQQAEESQEGCVLSLELTNTTVFEQQLNLDGDRLIGRDGAEYESSQSLSITYIPSNGLTGTIAPDQTLEGGLFFAAPAGIEADLIEIIESANSPPIIVPL